MNRDEPIPSAKADDPFEFGDRTIFQLRNQSFSVDENGDFGTIVSPVAGTRAIETAASPEPTDDADPIVRLEKKLDAAMRAIASMQQRLDSIDSTLARALNR